ncbi:linker histone H1 and H5 family-domain-containing protein [Zychaea mexicana]|uniref:linker histone H1 and H5 family-domain-containing protein n=1 Tax=Zychaea mexicana TaxID=64656 RepID=UPI0022FF1BC9|nr:linker histone H1 and H5 family-domain-containing protein [Zychaea mexicana]KAI9498513.1 linker histone H1 and H5 family-domain-containing protein [Zychaea mexicana]
MAPAAKKATTPAKKADHPTYEAMIKAAILALKERKGSSRPAIKKYILANYKLTPGSHFDTQINAAIKRGVTKGAFVLPKGKLCSLLPVTVSCGRFFVSGTRSAEEGEGKGKWRRNERERGTKRQLLLFDFQVCLVPSSSPSLKRRLLPTRKRRLQRSLPPRRLRPRRLLLPRRPLLQRRLHLQRRPPLPPPPPPPPRRLHPQRRAPLRPRRLHPPRRHPPRSRRLPRRLV